MNRTGNSFDFLRFVAAFEVLVGHHAALAGGQEFVVPIFRDTVAAVAVCAFFTMSGYLITNSLKANGSWSRFVAARALRILPNLTFALILTSLAMMIAFNNYGNLQAHVAYVTSNLKMFINGVTYTIPGVLEDRPFAGPNGSLWTLPYEIWMYAALFVLMSFRQPISTILLPATFLAAATLWVTASPGASTPFLHMAFANAPLGKLGTYFFAGATLSILAPLIKPRMGALIALILAPVIAMYFLPDLRLPLIAVSASTALIAFGKSSLASSFSRFGDPSYGIYIFAFPVQQLCLIYVPNYWASMAVAALVTTAIGYGTWHAFERRALLVKEPVGQWLASLFRDNSAPLAKSNLPSDRQQDSVADGENVAV